jgi:hypothetical protein
MSKAKYYIYRNLHKDCWSVRYKGKVIAHHKALLALGATLKVNEGGRQRVLTEQRKNVHAFVVCTSYQAAPHLYLVDGSGSAEVTYNPYKTGAFTTVGQDIPIPQDCVYKEVGMMSDHTVWLGDKAA